MHAPLAVNGDALLLHDDFPEMTGHEAPPPGGVRYGQPGGPFGHIWSIAGHKNK